MLEPFPRYVRIAAQPAGTAPARGAFVFILNCTSLESFALSVLGGHRHTKSCLNAIVFDHDPHAYAEVNYRFVVKIKLILLNLLQPTWIEVTTKTSK